MGAVRVPMKASVGSVEAISFIKVFQDCDFHSRIFCTSWHNKRSVMETFHWSELIMYKST